VNKFLTPLAGAGFIGLLVLSFYLGRTTTGGPRSPVRKNATAVTRPAPVPVPSPPVALPAAPLVFPKGRGKIAIVLDDWGYTMKQVPSLNGIRRPLTLAVLPELPHSADVARAARANGHEVILHMPMEALDPAEPREGSTLLSGMPRQQVIERLSRSLRSVPSARGISNHQGSKATADPALMEVVLREAKRRGLYFLDSYVSNRSVCAEVAAKVRIPFARRVVFLDNEQSSPAIQKHLAQLASIASEHGEAIGIGHDRPVMMEVLKKAVPALEKAGYTLVPVSELTEVPNPRSGD
jgi:hypothetical protein